MLERHGGQYSDVLNGHVMVSPFDEQSIFGAPH